MVATTTACIITGVSQKGHKRERPTHHHRARATTNHRERLAFSMDSIYSGTRSETASEDTRKDMRHVQCTLGTCVKLYSIYTGRQICRKPNRQKPMYSAMVSL